MYRTYSLSSCCMIAGIWGNSMQHYVGIILQFYSGKSHHRTSRTPWTMSGIIRWLFSYRPMFVIFLPICCTKWCYSPQKLEYLHVIRSLYVEILMQCGDIVLGLRTGKSSLVEDFQKTRYRAKPQSYNKGSFTLLPWLWNSNTVNTVNQSIHIEYAQNHILPHIKHVINE